MKTLFERYLFNEIGVSVADRTLIRRLRRQLDKAYRRKDLKKIDELETQLDSLYDRLEWQLEDEEADYEDMGSEEEIERSDSEIQWDPWSSREAAHFMTLPEIALGAWEHVQRAKQDIAGNGIFAREAYDIARSIRNGSREYITDKLSSPQSYTTTQRIGIKQGLKEPEKTSFESTSYQDWFGPEDYYRMFEEFYGTPFTDEDIEQYLKDNFTEKYLAFIVYDNFIFYGKKFNRPFNRIPPRELLDMVEDMVSHRKEIINRYRGNAA